MDIVTVFCHGKPEVWDRDEALDFFTKAVIACEGSEKGRYANILAQLKAGCSTCFDD